MFRWRIAACVLLAASPASAVRFRYPLANCGHECAATSAYFDLDDSDAGLRDWNCGAFTYEGHRGTDFALLRGFSAQNAGIVVVAAASGVVRSVHDGESDRCTSGACEGGDGYGNHLIITHGDGSESLYGHLRRGSITATVGQRVACGEPIANVGSSGFSTGPHLHFEVRVSGLAIDAFAARAACGGESGSRWVAQGSYQTIPSDSCDEGEDVFVRDAAVDAAPEVSSDAMDRDDAPPRPASCGCAAALPVAAPRASIALLLAALFARRRSRG